MLLIVRGGEEEARFWITRRLWLGVYRRLSRLAPAVEEAAAKVPAPPKQPSPIPTEEAKDAVLLHSVQIAKEGEGVRLVFSTDHDKLAINLNKSGFGQFRRMLDMQADRAGWDSPAAIERLDAQAAASAALQRASK